MRPETTPNRPFHHVMRLALCGALVVIAALTTWAAARALESEKAAGTSAAEEASRAPSFTAMPVAHPEAEPGPAFGARKDPFTGREAFHGGVDIIAPAGAEVTAAAAGIVSFAGQKGAYGLLVEIDHGHGWKTRYGNLKTIDVIHGQSVTAGQRIGNLGSTGRTTFPHVHVEVWKAEKLIDPATVLALPERKHETEEGAAQGEEAANAPPFTAMPLAEPYRITSPYGEHRDPDTERAAFHSGLDFGGPEAAEVRAAGAGVVSYAGRREVHGLVVEIDHGRGWRTRYSHLKSIDVKRGQSVTAGQGIGSMGESGRATGAHLHLEVRKDGKLVDPMGVLPLPERKQGGGTE